MASSKRKGRQGQLTVPHTNALHHGTGCGPCNSSAGRTIRTGATVSTILALAAVLALVFEDAGATSRSVSGDGAFEGAAGVSVSSIVVTMLVASAAQPYPANTSAQPTSHAG